MDGGFGNDVGVEAVTEVNRVDIITRSVVRILFATFTSASPSKMLRPQGDATEHGEV